MLTVTVDREDAWLFEAARMMVKRVAGGILEETVEALLGEGTTSLLSGVERADIVPFEEATDEDRAQRAWGRERARERTVKHLREEVDAAEMLGRLGIEPERRPPDEATMVELAEIEQRVVTGAVFGADSAAGAKRSEQPATGGVFGADSAAAATGREQDAVGLDGSRGAGTDICGDPRAK